MLVPIPQNGSHTAQLRGVPKAHLYQVVEGNPLDGQGS